MVSKNKIIFLDRDGVLLQPVIINRRTFAVNDVNLMKIYPDTYWALFKFLYLGFKIVVVTNQPDSFENAELSKQVHLVHYKLLDALNIDLILCCSHISSQNCQCRKPGTLMLEQGLSLFKAESSLSWMIGDRTSDVIAGNRLGLKTIQINRGWDLTESTIIDPDYKCTNLFEAAEVISRFAFR